MMRAITLWQPWAWAVIYAGKDVENRPRSLGYTGEIAIHAGLKLDDAWAADRILTITGHALINRDLWPSRGCIIGVVDIVLWRRSIEKEPSSPWEFGPWCALLRNPRPIACPVPVRGYQGTWTVPADVERAVRAQMGGGA
jgi:hypothetical protein